MANTASLPLAVDRWVPAYRTVRLVGIDAAGSSSRMEVRPDGDVPGTPLLRLDNTTVAGAVGIRLVGVTNENGGPVSTFEIVIGDAAIAALPFSGAVGVATELAYDWVITIGGRKRVLAGGPFIVLPGVTGADASPAQRQSAFVDPAAPDRTWDTAELTFAGGEIIEVSINGVALLVPYVVAARAAATEAVSARDEAVDASRSARADRAATAADRIVTSADRVQAGVERQQAQAASAAAIDAIAKAGGSITLPVPLAALTLAAMRAAAIPANGTLTQLLDPARAGLFRYDSSDLSAPVAIDVDNALYVAPAARPNGSAGAWVRIRGGDVQLAWSGVGPGTENADVALNRLLALMVPGEWLVLPGYELGIQGKVTLPFGVHIRGGGKLVSGLMARTANAKAFHAVHCRYGGNILRDFYAGGVKGQLTVGEAAAFHAYPGEVNQPATVTGDISNMSWENLRAVDCETGYRWGYNVTDTEGNGRLYHAKASWQINCDSEGVLSHNVETFAADDVTIIGGTHYMVNADASGKKAADPPKMLRIIGPRRLKVSALRLFGSGATNIVAGVNFELASPYSKANYWSLPGDVEVDDVNVSGCPTAVNVQGGQGKITWKGGILRGVPGVTSIAFRVSASGYLIQPQVVRDNPPPDTAAGEKGYKWSLHRLTVSGVSLFDMSEIGRFEGKIDLCTFDDIENYAPSVTAGRYAFTFDKGGNEFDVYRVQLRNCRDYAGRSVPTFIRVNDGWKGSQILVDDCAGAMTQNTAQRWPITATATALANVAIRLASPLAVRRIDPATVATIQSNLVEREPA